MTQEELNKIVEQHQHWIHEDFAAFVMEHFHECYADGESYGEGR